MTAPSRLDWSTLAATTGAVVVPVVLIAGVPRVLVPADVTTPTETAWTATAHPLWWPGTGSLSTAADGVDPVRRWIDPAQRWEFGEEIDLIKGAVDVRTLAFDLLDVDGAVTAHVSAIDGLARTDLAATIESGTTVVSVGDETVFTGSGFLAIGRETVMWGGTTGGGTVTLTARGKYGSRARRHLRTDGVAVPVTQGIPSWVGRVCTVWLARLSGTTLYDPTLQFVGVVGPGMQVTGTRWRVAVDPITRALDGKMPTLSVMVAGYSHRVPTTGYPVRTPLRVNWQHGTQVFLDETDSSGWHATKDRFKADLVAKVAAAFTTPGDVVLTFGPGGIARVSATNPDTSVWGHDTLIVWAPWNTPSLYTTDSDTAANWGSSVPFPEACVWLDGVVNLSSTDSDKLPTTLSYSHAVDDGTAQAGYFLRAKARDGVIEAKLLASDTGADTVTLSADRADPLLTAPTQAVLGCYCVAPNWWSAIRYACEALAAIDGLDVVEDAVDWDDLEAVATRYPTPGLPSGRAVTFYPGGPSVLETLRQHARIAGFALTMRDGRVSIVRSGETAATESPASTITAADLAGYGKPRQSLVELPDRVIGEVIFKLANDAGSVTYRSPRTSDAYGPGESIEIDVPPSIPVPNLSAFTTVAAQIGQLLTGGLDEPWRRADLVLPLSFAGLRIGDLAMITEGILPTTTGTRGLSGALGQVILRRLVYQGGREGSVTIGVRLSRRAIAGYAPEAPVGSIARDTPSAGKTRLVLDTTTAAGASGFAYPTSAADGAVTDAGASYFRVGDKVLLIEVDALSPIADEAFTIDAISGTTIDLTGAATASVAMAGKASVGSLKVLLVYDDEGNATNTGQRNYAFVARASTQRFANSDLPYRWAG